LSTAVLSVRVWKELKEEAKRLNINLKEVVERVLEEEIGRVRTFEEFMSGVKRLSVEQGMLEAFDIAVKNGITFYDASYVYVVGKLGLKLATED